MTPEEQRIAICQICPSATLNDEGEWVWSTYSLLRPFNPLHDLNACFEMEETLTTIAEQDKFCWWLSEIAPPQDGNYWSQVHATAEQRCESFLRVKGLWTGGPDKWGNE